MYTYMVPQTQDEVMKMIRLGELSHKEGAYENDEYDATRLVVLGLRAIAHPDQIFSMYVEKDDEVIGMMAGTIGTQFFSPDKVAWDLLLYIAKEFRGSRIALNLIRSFELWAKQQGAVRTQLGISTGIDIERTLQFYKRLGYEHTGYITRKTL